MRSIAPFGPVLLAVIAVVVVVALRRGGRARSAAQSEAPVALIDPRDLLFSLPTLADRLPEGHLADPMPADAFHLHEDDWRQVEFVGLGQQDEVEAELDRLRRFMAEHRKGIGFTDVHVRRSRPESLVPLRIESKALDALLPPAARRRPLVVGTEPWGPRVVNGLAVEIGPGAILYAHVVDGHLATIGLPLAWRKNSSREADELLATMARRLSLRLVDWPAAAWVTLE